MKVLNNYSIITGKDFLNNLKKKYNTLDIFKILDKLSSLNFLVMGDPIIDTYNFTDSVGVSSKSPTVSSRLVKSENYFGGSLAVAKMLSKLGCNVEILTYKPNTLKEKKILQDLNKKVRVNKFCNTKDFPQIFRFVDAPRNVKLYQYYYQTNFRHNHNSLKKITNILSDKKYKKHKKILIDFGFGFFDKYLVKKIEKKIKVYSLNVHINSLNASYNKFTKYKKFTYVALNKQELQAGLNTDSNKIDDLINSARLKKIKVPFSVTLGVNGSVFIKDYNKVYMAPAFISKPVDTVGCGDAYFAITAALVESGVENELLPFIGNVYAGLHSMNFANKKIISLQDIKQKIFSLLE